MAPEKLCRSMLVVEDDQDIRETLQQLLELEGYRVKSAGNGKQALELLGQMSTPCLILLDLMMPIMNGWEFLKAKRGDIMIAPIPVVIVSALDDTGKIAHEGVRGYIKKPIEYTILMKIVSQYCGAGLSAAS